jgi:aryl-alcohol dehydrogenase-like predicted oxidoreductase
MNYRRLGRCGLQVSELSLGSWVTYGNQMDARAARECMAAAWDAGVNFFDNAEIGLGLTTWSPLASGLLTGKYRDGIPPGSRGALENYAFLRERLTDPQRNAMVGELDAVARELGCTLAQLALAWCLKNPHVCSVITGASRAEQVVENMRALEVVERLDAAALARIEAITGGAAE